MVLFGMDHDASTDKFEILVRFRVQQDDCSDFIHLVIASLFEEHAVNSLLPARRGVSAEEGDVSHCCLKVGDNGIRASGFDMAKVNEV